MKIYQLLDSFHLSVSNEESNFIRRHRAEVRLTSLDEHDRYLAQNLVRKGIYAISNDNNTIVKQVNEINS